MAEDGGHDLERIPYIKWGLNLHFDLDEIDAWIDQHRRPARRTS